MSRVSCTAFGFANSFNAFDIHFVDSFTASFKLFLCEHRVLPKRETEEEDEHQQKIEKLTKRFKLKCEFHKTIQ